MTDRTLRNVAASVHDRLLTRSRETRENFQFLLQRYAAERFLYRLGRSKHRERFVLKGAMLFALWGGPIYRPTRDLDFTGYGSREADAVLAALREVCGIGVPDDGLSFETEPLTGEPIHDDSEYDGLRVRFRVMLGSARIPMQIDIGFGNAIEPPANDVDYPTILDRPAPCIRASPPEAVVAEKFHTMVVRGELNSRYKDFYDLYVLARQFSFDGMKLERSIGTTFKRRRTTIDKALPTALTPRFYEDGTRAGQWRAYLTRNSLPGATADFGAVGELTQGFLGPVWAALAENATFPNTWQPGGPWR